jgi:hypothetical protein
MERIVPSNLPDPPCGISLGENVNEELPALPALPEPAYDWTCDYYEGWHCNSGASAEPIDRYDQISLFTEEQMREYGAECARKEGRIIQLLVAAGHVTADQVAKAREIAAAFRLGQTS